MTALIARLEAATEGSRELDALIVAELNDAMMKPYPPQTDFGPGNHWQFWSRDGKHFLGNEATPRFHMPHYTTARDAALPGEEIHRVERVQSPTVTWWKAYQGIHIGQGKTEALARRIAALKARIAP